jgi:RNA polymerase-binding protein DksA
MDTKHAKTLLQKRMDELRQIARPPDEDGSSVEAARNAGDEIAPTEAAELASETIERELDMTIREQAQASLHDVERALGRLEKGTYGVCPVCGKPIADERLEAKPEAEYCVEHQPR